VLHQSSCWVVVLWWALVAVLCMREEELTPTKTLQGAATTKVVWRQQAPPIPSPRAFIPSYLSVRLP